MTQAVLAVFPHPDDETFGKSGALALHAEAGASVTLICATSGQMGRRMGNPCFANRESLPEIRERELDDACKAIGIEHLHLWRLRDKTLQFEDPEELADRIYKVIEEIRPFRIYSYYPEHGVHPDHDALSYATILAVSRLPKTERPEIFASAFSINCMEVLGPPDILLDVSGVLEKKLAAIRAHRSQSEVMMKKMDEELAAHPELKNEILAGQMTERFWTYQWPVEHSLPDTPMRQTAAM